MGLGRMMALSDERKPRDWLQLSASVALLLGLILVGIQINQSNAIAGAELLNTNIESTISREIALFDESPDHLHGGQNDARSTVGS